MAPGPVHEQGQRVCRRKLAGVPNGVELERLDDLDVARVQLLAKLGELFVLEIVLERERLERALFDCSALLGFVEKGANRYFKNVAQFSLTSFLALGTSCESSAPLEPLGAATASRCPLAPGIGRVTVGAHVDDDLAPRRAGRESVAARRAADGR
jgi:hypothetical protein